MLPNYLPSYPAPAKLNLNLHIVGRRADGYHELESIFTLIDWCDYVAIEPRDDGEIVLHTPTQGVEPEQDLTVRAAKLLQSFSGCLKSGADIWLQKNLPMGGGLGGGSSDAATVLMVLNCLWQLNLSQPQLIELGAQLGADVPFFIFGQTALARGIGERLESLAVPPQWYVIAKPDVHVATPLIFAHADLTRDTPRMVAPNFENVQPFRNDMQAVVLREYTEVKQVFEQLQAFGEPLMTGSGACVFLRFTDEYSARDVANRLSENMQIHVAQGLAQHPLFAIL
ncbi:4-(cytidine 5'-diphospho)-2-C-methyl-D-erythritol kinase [Neisseriaceae bacterium B1]